MLRNTSAMLFLVLAVVMMFVAPYQMFAQAAPAADNPGGVAAPVEKHNGGQLTASAMVVLLINWLKSSKIAPWITAETAKINKTVAVVASLLAAVGVHMAFDREAGRLVIDGLTVTGVASMAVAWAKSYVFQQTIFNMSKAA